jgi:hypothetical protein
VRVDATAGQQLTNSLLDVRDNLWWSFATNGIVLPSVWETPAAGVLFEAGRGNDVLDPMLRSINRTNDPAFALDPRPTTGSPALTSSRTAPDDGFYDPVAFKGAFSNANWAVDWTAVGAYSIMSSSGAGQPRYAGTTNTPPDSVTLTTGRNGAELQISFPTQTGYNYQLESVSSISGTWQSAGDPAAGTGSATTKTLTTSGSEMYFRVRVY